MSYGCCWWDKSEAFHDVKLGKVYLTKAKSFAEYPDNLVDGLILVYLSNHNIWSEPKCFSNAPKKAFDIPKVVRTFNKDCGCKVSFYKLASDAEPFKNHDTEMVGVCGHNHVTLKYDS